MISKKNLKKKIIITGANGHLGSNLIKYFCKFDYHITCIYRKNLKSKIKKKNIVYIKHDLQKKIPSNKIKGKFDALLHFAGPKNSRAFVNRNKKKVLEAIKLDKNIIDFCIKRKIRRFIYASSSAVYDLNEGVNKNDSSFKECNVNNSTNPDGLYGATKRATEKYLDIIPEKKIKSTSCRIFSIYGPNTNTIINNWKNKIKKNKKIHIWGSKNIVRSWLYIDDFLSALQHILQNQKKIKVINIGSNEITSLNKIIKIIKKKYKKRKVNLVEDKGKYPGPKVRFSNNEKLIKLGWQQKITLFNGLDLIK